MFQAAYKSKPAAYISSIKNRFTSAETVSLPGIKQKCVLAYLEASKSMYIGFKGSNDLDDWLVNLDTGMVILDDFLYEERKEPEMKRSKLEVFGPKVKSHAGFTKRAQAWMDILVPKIEEFDPDFIYTTGHSLGAATSSMVHIMLAREFCPKIRDGCDTVINNVTFALPLFGNLDLKSHLQFQASENMKNMFHFVNYTDLVPAIALMPHAYSNLSYPIQKTLSNPSFWTNLFMFFGKIKPETSEEKVELKQIASNLSKEIAKKKGNLHALFEKILPETYMPIGNYIFMKGSDLHEFSFKQDSDHQWIGQILIESLKILNRIHSKHLITIGYTGENKQVCEEILKNHAIETYGSQMTECLTNGVHDNFMSWKMESD